MEWLVAGWGSGKGISRRRLCDLVEGEVTGWFRLDTGMTSGHKLLML